MPLNWLPHFVNYLAASPIISSCIRRDPIITQLYLYLFNHKHCTNFIPCVYISSFCRFLGSNFFTPSNFHAVVLRMISFGCDYCWTIHSSHFDHKKHMQRCQVCYSGKTCYFALQVFHFSNFSCNS